MGSKHRPASHPLKHIRGGRGGYQRQEDQSTEEREREGILCRTQGVGGRGLRVTAACWWKRRDTPRRLMFDGTTAHKSPCPTQVNQDNMTWGRVSCLWQYIYMSCAPKPTVYNYSECPQHVDQTKANQELILHKMRGRIGRHGFGGWVGCLQWPGLSWDELLNFILQRILAFQFRHTILSPRVKPPHLQTQGCGDERCPWWHWRLDFQSVVCNFFLKIMHLQTPLPLYDLWVLSSPGAPPWQYFYAGLN